MHPALIALSLLAHGVEEPFNLQGRLADLIAPGATWSIPSQGATFTLTLEKSATDLTPQWEATSEGWKGKGVLKSHFAYENGGLKGTVSLDNGTDFHLAGTRFDLVSATETYETEKGEATRALDVKPDSPLLFGDLMPEEASPDVEIAATGLAWKPETKRIVVSFRLSGYTFRRNLFPDHTNSSLLFDSKGDLLIGSGQQTNIYKANLASGEVEPFAAVADYRPKMALNPTNGEIAYVSGGEYRFLTADGQPGSDSFSQNEEITALTGWPSDAGYDAKGDFFVTFGTSVSMINRTRPAFTVHSIFGKEIEGYPKLAVAPDGHFYVAANDCVTRFTAGGKTPTRIIGGPDWHPGATMVATCLCYDAPRQTLWVGYNSGAGIIGRIDAFDGEGRYLCSIGRGGPRVKENSELWPSQSPYPNSLAVSAKGWVYVANYEQTRPVMEFSPIGN